MKKEKQTKKSFKLKGEMYIDTLIGMMITFLVIALGLSILPVIIGQYQLSTEVNNIARSIAITGQCNTNSTIRVNGENISIYNNLTILDGECDTSSNPIKMQLGTEFNISVSVTVNISMGGFGSFPINLNSSATGRSETYWKEMDLNQKQP